MKIFLLVQLVAFSQLWWADVMASSELSPEESHGPEYFLCYNPACDVKLGTGRIQRGLLGSGGNLKDMKLTMGNRVRIYGKHLTPDDLRWLVEFDGNKGLVDSNFIKELQIPGEESYLQLDSLVKGRNPFHPSAELKEEVPTEESQALSNATTESQTSQSQSEDHPVPADPKLNIHNASTSLNANQEVNSTQEHISAVKSTTESSVTPLDNSSIVSAVNANSNETVPITSPEIASTDEGKKDKTSMDGEQRNVEPVEKGSHEPSTTASASTEKKFTELDEKVDNKESESSAEGESKDDPNMEWSEGGQEQESSHDDATSVEQKEPSTEELKSPKVSKDEESHVNDHIANENVDHTDKSPVEPVGQVIDSSQKTPTAEPVEGVSQKTPTAEAVEGVSQKTPPDEPVEDVSQKTPTAEPVKGASQKTPTAEPVEDVSQKTPTAEPVEGASQKTPTAEPVEGVSQKTPTAEPVEGVSQKTPTDEPVEGVSQKTPTTEPVEDVSQKTPTAEPVEGVSQKTPTVEPVEGVSQKTPVVEPVEGVSQKTAEPVESVNQKTAEPVDSVSQKTAEPVDSVSQKTAEPVEAVSEKTAELVEAVNEKTAEPVEGVNQKTAEPVVAVSQKTSEPVEGVNQKTAEPVERVNQKTAEPVERVSQKTADPVEAVSQKTAEPVEAVSQKTAEPVEGVNQKTAESVERVNQLEHQDVAFQKTPPEEDMRKKTVSENTQKSAQTSPSASISTSENAAKVPLAETIRQAEQLISNQSATSHVTPEDKLDTDVQKTSDEGTTISLQPNVTTSATETPIPEPKLETTSSKGSESQKPIVNVRHKKSTNPVIAPDSDMIEEHSQYNNDPSDEADSQEGAKDVIEAEVRNKPTPDKDKNTAEKSPTDKASVREFEKSSTTEEDVSHETHNNASASSTTQSPSAPQVSSLASEGSVTNPATSAPDKQVEIQKSEPSVSELNETQSTANAQHPHPPSAIHGTETKSEDTKEVSDDKQERSSHITIDGCLDHLASHSIFFRWTIQTVSVLKLPIRQVISLLPTDLLQAVDSTVPLYFHMRFENFLLCLLLTGCLMFLTVWSRCVPLFNKDWSRVLARHLEQIHVLQDQLAEKDRLNASMNAWNVDMAKQIKCQENEVIHLKSIADSSAKISSKDMEQFRAYAAKLEAEAAQYKLRIQELEQQMHHNAMEWEQRLSAETQSHQAIVLHHTKQLEANEELLNKNTSMLQEVTEQRDELQRQISAYYEQIAELKSELEGTEKSRAYLENNLQNQMLLTQSLKEDLAQLRIFDVELSDLIQKRKLQKAQDTTDWDWEEEAADEQSGTFVHIGPTSDSSQEEKLKEKIEAFFDNNKLRSDLRTACDKNLQLESRLKVEADNLKLVEQRLEEVLQENSRIKEGYREAEEIKTATERKLDILSQYFKEREVEFQVSVGKEVVQKNYSADEYTVEKSRRELLENELSLIREQVRSMKQELEESSRRYRKQVMQLEKRAHESWLSSRAAEREVKELKEENLSLRQRVYDVMNNGTLPPGKTKFALPPGLGRLALAAGPSTSHSDRSSPAPPPPLPFFGLPPMPPMFPFPPGMTGGSNHGSLAELATNQSAGRPNSRHSNSSETAVSVQGGGASNKRPPSNPSAPAKTASSPATVSSIPPQMPLPPLLFPPMPPNMMMPGAFPLPTTSAMPFQRKHKR